MGRWCSNSMITKVIGKAVVSLFVILFIVSFFFAFQYYSYLHKKPLNVGSTGLLVVVPPGSSFQKVADSLTDAKILEHPEWFMGWVQVTGARSKLKTGEYLVKAGTTPQALIKLLISGKVVQYPLTIVDGWTFDRVLQAVNDSPKIKHTLLGMAQAEVAAKLGLACINLEGLFYPDTYLFPANTTDIAFLQRANKMMNEKLQALWKNRTTTVLKTPYEALILASIIQRESGYVNEYPEIAGVYTRRLERNMPLQADPTVIYGLGKAYTGKLTFDHLKQSSPYNTYLNTGLPPTPIAMPNIKAIEAAMNPKPGDTLYFVATGTDKRHVFSTTLQQHQQAVIRYRTAVANIQNSAKMQSSQTVQSSAMSASAVQGSSVVQSSENDAQNIPNSTTAVPTVMPAATTITPAITASPVTTNSVITSTATTPTSSSPSSVSTITPPKTVNSVKKTTAQNTKQVKDSKTTKTSKSSKNAKTTKSNKTAASNSSNSSNTSNTSSTANTASTTKSKSAAVTSTATKSSAAKTSTEKSSTQKKLKKSKAITANDQTKDPSKNAKTSKSAQGSKTSQGTKVPPGTSSKTTQGSKAVKAKAAEISQDPDSFQ